MITEDRAMADITITADWTAPQAHRSASSWLERSVHHFRVLRRRARRDRRIAALIRRIGADRAGDLGLDLDRYRSYDWIAGLFRNMTSR
jgi:hypothetical protein